MYQSASVSDEPVWGGTQVVPEQRDPQELERYLLHLGLSPATSSESGPSPAALLANESGPLPPIVGTAMGVDQLGRLPGFLEACQTHFPDHSVVVYGLDFGPAELLAVSRPLTPPPESICFRLPRECTVDIQ